MSALDMDTKDIFDGFSRFEAELNGAGKAASHAFRKAALDRFAECGLPNKRQEEWKYTDLKKAWKGLDPFASPRSTQTDVSLPIPDFCANWPCYRLVLLDGKIKMDLSNLPEDNKLIIKQIHSIDSSNGKIDLDQYDLLSTRSQDPLSDLNTAFAEDGVLIRLKKGSELDKPLLILQYFSNEHAAVRNPRHLLHSEANSQMSIINLVLGTEPKAVLHLNDQTELSLETGAKLSWHELQLSESRVSRVHNLHASVAANAHFGHHGFSSGNELIRNNIHVHLDGPGAHTQLSGLDLGTKKDHTDNHITVYHHAADCTSDQQYKTILNQDSNSVFNGKILVDQDAQRTAAFQNSKNLLLSERANIYTKPQLEILADDVKCSHGATCGQLDEQAVFYLMARGISEKMAREMLTKAFGADLVDALEDVFLKEYLHDRMVGILDTDR